MKSVAATNTPLKSTNQLVARQLAIVVGLRGSLKLRWQIQVSDSQAAAQSESRTSVRLNGGLQNRTQVRVV